MARPVQRKDHRVSMRLADADVAIIDRAASLRGYSRAEFMRDAAASGTSTSARHRGIWTVCEM